MSFIYQFKQDNHSGSSQHHFETPPNVAHHFAFVGGSFDGTVQREAFCSLSGSMHLFTFNVPAGNSKSLQYVDLSVLGQGLIVTSAAEMNPNVRIRNLFILFH